MWGGGGRPQTQERGPGHSSLGPQKDPALLPPRVLSLRPPEPREEGLLCCDSVLWGPQEGHTASWGCGHRSTVSDPRGPQLAWPPASQEFLFSSPLFVPADTTGTQEANEGQVPEQRSSLCKVWPNLHTSGTFFLRSQTPGPSTEPLLTPHSRRQSQMLVENGTRRPGVFLRKTLPPHRPCGDTALR